jgi:arylsulfatase
MVDGVKQEPIEGVSMLYTLTNAKAESTHKTQYFEIFGNRAIYSDGWFAGTIHRAPWESEPRRKLTEDIWELYDTRNDFSLSNNIAGTNAAKLKELQDLFIQEAIRNRVLPIDDRVIERANAAMAGRPDLIGDRTTLTLADGMRGLTENTFINVKNRSFSIAADVDAARAPANGVILAQGGRFGGWSFYVKDGRPAFAYNFLGLTTSTIRSARPLGAGKSSIRMDFDYDGGGPGKGGTATLSINGEKVATGRIEKTQGLVFSADETAGVGRDDATPVTTDYKEQDNAFTGRVLKVVISVQPVGAAVKASAAILDAARGALEAAK